jgi:hypothetical protein
MELLKLLMQVKLLKLLMKVEPKIPKLLKQSMMQEKKFLLLLLLLVNQSLIMKENRWLQL